MITVEYYSINSGGHWWLEDQDWYNLESAGWKVGWKSERWLGALARSAKKQFASFQEAIEEFEALTGADVSDKGCNCCGCPHSFTVTDETGKVSYYSAEDFAVHSRKNPWE